jgi:hypothetical protein
MRRKSLLSALVLPLCLGLVSKAPAQQAPEDANVVQNAEMREWKKTTEAIENDTESIRLQDEDAEECRQRLPSARPCLV